MTDSYLQTCIDLVERGGEQAKQAFETHVIQGQFKTDNSYVSSVDLAIEAEYVKEITSRFPDHNIVAEESGNHHVVSEYDWYLDPVDGTSNFLFGLPLYGSMVSLTHQGNVIATAVRLPSLNLTIAADNSQRTTINSKPIGETPINTIDKSTLIIDCGKSKQGKLELDYYLSQHETKYRSVRRFACVATHAAMLNSNQPFVSIIIDAPPHDLCPISLLMKQSGFQIYNREGNPWNSHDKDLISIHQTLQNDVLPTIIDICNKC